MSFNLESKQLLDYFAKTSGGGITSFDFGASGDGVYQTPLDGDVDDVYLLEGRWQKAVNGTAFLRLQPNALSTNQETSRINTTNGGTVSAGSTANLDLAAVDTALAGGSVVGFSALLWASRNTFRPFRSHSFACNAGSQSACTQFGGGWFENSTQITSLRIICDVANGIGTNTLVRLYRLTNQLSAAIP